MSSINKYFCKTLNNKCSKYLLEIMQLSLQTKHCKVILINMGCHFEIEWMRKIKYLLWYYKLNPSKLLRCSPHISYISSFILHQVFIYEDLLYKKWVGTYTQCMHLRHENHNSSLIACTWMILPNACDVRQVIFCHQRKLPLIAWWGNYDDYLIVLYFFIFI